MIQGIIQAIKILDNIQKDFENIASLIPPSETYARGFTDALNMAVIHLDEYAKELAGEDEEDSDA